MTNKSEMEEEKRKMCIDHRSIHGPREES